MDSPTTKLIVVDDEPSIRMTLSLVLGELGLAVRTAEDGFSGLAEMRAAVPDILLSDLNMPGMSGFEFLSVVRRRFPGVYVIAMSGTYFGGEAPAGVAADSFYQKGSGVMALVDMVTALKRPVRTPREGNAKKSPIWIQRNWNDGSESSTVTIACPECMRTFPQMLFATTRQVRETRCVHCGSLVQFAVIEPVGEGCVLPFQRARSTAFPAVHRLRRASN